MKSNTIEAGQTLTARSACDSGCIFSATVLDRRGSFATVKIDGHCQPRRVKVRKDDSGEFVFALGLYSMAPLFRP